MHEAPGAEPAPGMAPKTLLREQVNALYEQAQLGVVVALGVGGMFVYVFHRVVAPSLVWGWYAAIIAGQAVSLVQWRRFRLAPLVDNWEPKPWLVGYVLRVLAAGLLLGSMPWIFFLPHYGDARWLTILTICSLAAGSITSYAYHPPTMLLFLITLTAPTAVRLLQFLAAACKP